jgi:hypothetical protein
VAECPLGIKMIDPIAFLKNDGISTIMGPLIGIKSVG